MSNGRPPYTGGQVLSRGRSAIYRQHCSRSGIGRGNYRHSADSLNARHRVWVDPCDFSSTVSLSEDGEFDKMPPHQQGTGTYSSPSIGKGAPIGLSPVGSTPCCRRSGITGLDSPAFWTGSHIPCVAVNFWKADNKDASYFRLLSRLRFRTLQSRARKFADVRTTWTALLERRSNGGPAGWRLGLDRRSSGLALLFGAGELAAYRAAQAVP